MLSRLRRLLLALENGLLILLLTAMIGLAGWQIVLRNVWDSGIIWAEPLLRLAVLWVGLFGAMIATRQDEHIRIDVLSRYLPERLKSSNRRLLDLFSAVICALLAYHSARFVIFDWQDGIEAFATIPAWVCELILPLGFGVMALRFLLSSFAHESADK